MQKRWTQGKGFLRASSVQGLTAYSAIIDWFEGRPINKAMREKVAQCIRGRLDIIGVEWTSSGAEVKMLDYACGNGFLSRVRRPTIAVGRQ